MRSSLPVIDVTSLSFEEVISRLSVMIPWVQPPFGIALEFLAEFPVSKTLRETIAYIFSHHVCLEQYISQFKIVIDELVNNAIEHGSAPGDIARIEILMSVDNGVWKLDMSVLDHGHGSNAKTAAQLRDLERLTSHQGMRSLHERRGRGLFFLIKKIVDSIDFTDREGGGIEVHITKVFPSAVCPLP